MKTYLALVKGKRHIKMAEAQEAILDHALSWCGGNRTKAAKVLGVAKSTFYRKKPVKKNKVLAHPLAKTRARMQKEREKKRKKERRRRKAQEAYKSLWAQS